MLGFLQLSGEVEVNGMRAADGQTIFPGDTVRTGGGGAAVFNAPGVGALTLESQTEVSFGVGQKVASLKQGTVDIRSFQAHANLDIQFGRFALYTSSSESEAAGVLTVGPNGAARVECRGGTIGVTALQGAEAVLLRTGQVVRIAADGTMQGVESAQGAPAPATTTSTTTSRPTTPPTARNLRTLYILLAVGGAGGVTAAVLALVAKKSTPLSPATP